MISGKTVYRKFRHCCAHILLYALFYNSQVKELIFALIEQMGSSPKLHARALEPKGAVTTVKSLTIYVAARSLY